MTDKLSTLSPFYSWETVELWNKTCCELIKDHRANEQRWEQTVRSPALGTLNCTGPPKAMKFTANNTAPLKDNFIYMHTHTHSLKDYSVRSPWRAVKCPNPLQLIYDTVNSLTTHCGTDMLIFNLQMLSMVNIPNSLKLTKYKHYTMHLDFI